MRKVGIKDVAQAAGVSVTTVSHALSGEGKVSAATREKVAATARELGYRPNRLAAGLRSRSSKVFGLVSDEIVTTPFAGDVLRGVQNAADKAGFVVMTVNSERSSEVEQRQIRALLQHQVDGIIYARMYNQIIDVPSVLDQIPTVVLDAQPRSGDFPFVVPDEVQVARTAVAHLAGYGHTDIGFVQNVDDIPASRGRLAGYLAEQEARGIEPQTANIVYASSNADSARIAATELLSRPQPPTAIFCFNDRMAMGVYQAAQAHGLNIPEDLSIVSVDNFEVVAESLLPSLSTVALPHYEMGEWAVEKLFELMGQAAQSHSDGPAAATATPDPKGPQGFSMSCPLIERNSVASPKK